MLTFEDCDPGIDSLISINFASSDRLSICCRILIISKTSIAREERGAQANAQMLLSPPTHPQLVLFFCTLAERIAFRDLQAHSPTGDSRAARAKQLERRNARASQPIYGIRTDRLCVPYQTASNVNSDGAQSSG